MKDLKRFIKPYLKFVTIPLVLLSLLSIVMSLTAVSFAFFSKSTIDAAIGGDESFKSFAVILISILFVQLSAQSSTHYYKVHFQNKLYKRMQKDYYKYLLYGQMPLINKEHSSNYVHLFKADLSLVSEGVADILPRIIFYVFRFSSAFVLLFILSKTFAVLFLGLGLLLLLVSRFFRKPLFQTHKKAIKQESDLYTYMTDSISHIEVLKAFESESFADENLDLMTEDLIKKRMAKQRISITASLGLNIFFSFGYAFSIIFGAYQISLGLLTLGSLTAIIQLVQNIQSPFSGLSEVIPKYYQMLASIERLSALSDITMESDEKIEKRAFTKISFEHINFAYEDKAVLNNFSLDIHNKDHLWIKGASGLGKTTLLKLLLGFITPAEGSLNLKTDLGDIPISPASRAYFSYVPQTPYIFNDTIYNNLTLKKDIPMNLVVEACIKADIDFDIQALEKGYDTILGEDGRGLSLGQLQRLSISRALLKDAPVLLLDEITASLDLASEKKIYASLLKLTDKTLVIVSHKDISYLEGLKIVEFKTL